MENFGFPLSRHEILALMNKFDSDESGTISVDEVENIIKGRSDDDSDSDDGGKKGRKDKKRGRSRGSRSRSSSRSKSKSRSRSRSRSNSSAKSDDSEADDDDEMTLVAKEVREKLRKFASRNKSNGGLKKLFEESGENLPA